MGVAEIGETGSVLFSNPSKKEPQETFLRQNTGFRRQEKTFLRLEK